MNNLKFFLLSFVLVFVIGFIALAQEENTPAEVTNEETTAEITEAVNLDEDIQPQDLEVSEPKLLPDSPFYFLKNWSRTIQSTFTFNTVKKAELRLKFANEKLMEVKKIAEKTDNPEIIKKATENYQREIEKIKNQAEKIKEKAEENPQVDKFLDKFIDQQTLHQKLLQKLETQVPEEVLEKIKEVREEHLEKFQEVMLKLEDRKEKITEKLDEILEAQKGSDFKEFKNLEFLKNLEEKVPEEAKEAIQKVQEKVLERLQENLEKITPEAQEKFKEYVGKVSGEKEKQLEIMENLKTRIKESPATPIRIELKEKLEEGKTNIIEKGETTTGMANPASVYCKKLGYQLEIRTNSDGGQYGICIFPDGSECEEWKFYRNECGTAFRKAKEMSGVCIALWDPVCGKNGKTYSNSCFAGLARVEIDYKGACKETVQEIKPESNSPLKSLLPELAPLREIQQNLLPKY